MTQDADRSNAANVEALRARLEEAQETLRAIRSGEVDALVVLGPQGEQVYTLKGADEPYRVMVEEMTEGAVTCAPDGTVLYCNARFAELLRVRLEQTIGASLQSFVAPDERRTIEALLAQARAKPVRRRVNLRAADGSGFPVIFSAHNLQLGRDTEAIAAVATDLSEEAAAAQAKARLAAIVETSEDAIVSTSLDGVVQTWNAAAERMFGYTAAEAIGKPVEQLIIPPEQVDEYVQLVAVARRGGRLEHRETMRRTKDGSLIEVSVSRASVSDVTGRIVGVSAILHDISERKRLEAQLRQHREHLEELVKERTSALEEANKNLEGFAYSVSHDLRAPLRAVDGFSQILLKQYENKLDEEGKHYLAMVRDNAKRMARLIEDILVFSRTGRAAMNISDVDMELLAREVFEDIKPSLAGRNVSVEIKPLPRCLGDRELLRKVWASLLGNAVKFTRPVPAALIEAGARTEGAENIYYVKDNGVGFDMQYAGKLFGVFQRLHTVEEFEGTGMGLAIVKLVVARHSGRVWAEGKVGEGAAFYFSLPLRKEKT